jgi:hypothetical protein
MLNLLSYLLLVPSCEHYNPKVSRDHLVNYDVGNGLYDVDYLEALFMGGEMEVQRLEEEIFEGGEIPLSSCSTVSNSSSIKVCCRQPILLL